MRSKIDNILEDTNSDSFDEDAESDDNQSGSHDNQSKSYNNDSGSHSDTEQQGMFAIHHMVMLYY